MNITDKLADALRTVVQQHDPDEERRSWRPAHDALREYDLSVPANEQPAAPSDTMRIEPLAATQGADMALCTDAGIIAIIQHDPDIQLDDEPDFDSVVWDDQDRTNAQRLVDGWNGVALVRAYNEALNVAERVPTADDYNELLSILGV